jgi:hypothetical protein
MATTQNIDLIAGNNDLARRRVRHVHRALDQVLLRHADNASTLADLTAQLEEAWLRFTAASEAAMLPTALNMIERLDRLRWRQTEEVRRTAALLHELSAPPPARVNLVVRNEGQAVIVAPALPRHDEAE